MAAAVIATPPSNQARAPFTWTRHPETLLSSIQYLVCRSNQDHCIVMGLDGTSLARKVWAGASQINPR
jgi:hypothetical protein